MSSSRYPFNYHPNRPPSSMRRLSRTTPRSDLVNSTTSGMQASSRAIVYDAVSSTLPVSAPAMTASPSDLRNIPPSSMMALRTHKIIRPVTAAVFADYQDFARQGDPRSFFTLGKVFVMLEEQGINDIDNASGVTDGNPHGDSPQAQTRRFVVVQPGERDCSAIPIRTYLGQGVSISSDRKSDHAIVYTTPTPPELLRSEYSGRNESPVRAQPIKVVPDYRGTRLSEFSRLNFRRIYRIDHGCRVKSFGTVHQQSIGALVYQFRLVWRDTVPMGVEPVRSLTSNELMRHTTASSQNNDPFPEFYRRADANSFFSIGRIFSVPWVEQEDENGTTVSRIEFSPTYTRHGKLIHTPVRKFVVIASETGFCRALSIQTYGRKGVGKEGVVKSEHGIIFSGSIAPAWLSTEVPNGSEQGMQLTPIRMTPIHPGIQLDILSRLNYKRIYAVYHDVRVKYLGNVDGATMAALRSQFQTVQAASRQLVAVPFQTSTYSPPQQYTTPTTNLGTPGSSSSRTTHHVLQQQPRYRRTLHAIRHSDTSSYNQRSASDRGDSDEDEQSSVDDDDERSLIGSDESEGERRR